MKHFSAGLVGVFVLTLIFIARVEAEHIWVEAGPAYRAGMDLKASGSSYVQEQGVRAARPFHRRPAGVGGAGAFADRTYDDGYVNQDPGTGNPASIDPNVTWFWGYNNSAQYNASRETLTFQRGGGRQLTRRIDQDDGFADDSSFSGIGVGVAAGYPVRNGADWSVDIVGGLRFFRNDKKSFTASTFAESYRQREYRYVDTYDVSGVAIPPAPHQGTFDGPFDDPPVIPSPTIPNRPANRQEQNIRSSSWSAQNEVRIVAESDLLELRLGPQLSMRLGETVALRLTPVVTLNYLDADITRREHFTATYAGGRQQVLNSWRDKRSASDWLWGAGIQAGAGIYLSELWSVQVAVGYDWVESMRTQIGPNTVKMDPSGYTVSAMLRRELGGGGIHTASVGQEADEISASQIRAMLARKPSRSTSSTDIHAPVPLRAPTRNAPTTASVPANPGRETHQAMRALYRETGDRATVMQEIERMKEEEPARYSALVEYMQAQQTPAAQLVMRR